jgi:hypothetical protein
LGARYKAVAPIAYTRVVLDRKEGLCNLSPHCVQSR